ncbi:MAG: UDP-N-acetylglucosamine 2-epimerase [Bdellovibrio sp.]
MTKICVFSSTRADYGILSPLLRKLNSDGHFEMRLFVTGTHLLDEHGLTVKEIEKDGFAIFYRVALEMKDQQDIFHLKTMGDAIVEFSKALSRDLPDVAVVLGDRYEALSFAISCNGLGIPVVHLHGGEVTEGALDDGYRHCITKLSHLHFVAAEKYRARVIQLGESPERVFNVGALGVDNIKQIPLFSKREMENELGRSFKEKLIAVTYHPETANISKDKGQVTSLLGALKKLLDGGDVSIVFTRANADHGNEEVHEHIHNFVSMNSANCIYVTSLGMKRYLSLLKCADVVAGNSSSGIIEAPALGTPTVNVGDRQKGREMADSVFSVDGLEENIYAALKAALAFKASKSSAISSLYGDGNAAKKMLVLLKEQIWHPYPKKQFYDAGICSEKVNL